MPATRSLFKVGTVLLYYNKWTGWNSNEMRDEFFNRMSFNQITHMRRGDMVWLEDEPLHPNGKVYGRRLMKIDRVEKINKDSIRIYFTAKGNMTTVERHGFGANKFFLLKDERKTKSFIKDNPLVTKIDPFLD